MAERILIIEDDYDLSGIMGDYLRKEQFEVKQAYTGTEGIEAATEWKPELIILDLMLPEVDGVEVCRNIRLSSHAPIIIVSAKSSDYDKVLTLGMGADDYLTKPFSLVELYARIRSHLRRCTTFINSTRSKEDIKAENDINVKQYGNLLIDYSGYRVMVEGEEIPFTSKEFKLLEFLTNHPGQVFSKEQLINKIWGYTEYIDENTIAVYIGRVREKLSKIEVCGIKTVRGIGYKWEGRC